MWEKLDNMQIQVSDDLCMPYWNITSTGSPCSDANAKLPYTILPTEPGSLLSLAPPEAAPPAEPPAPILEASDVVDPPLPPVADLSEKSAPPAATPPAPTEPSGQPGTSANAVICLLAVVLSIIYLNYH